MRHGNACATNNYFFFFGVSMCAHECEWRCNSSALKMRFSLAMALELDRKKCDAKNFFFGTAWCSGCCRRRRRIILPLSSWDRFFSFLFFSFCLDFYSARLVSTGFSLFFSDCNFAFGLIRLQQNLFLSCYLRSIAFFCCCRRHRCCCFSSQPAHERSFILFCF